MRPEHKDDGSEGIQDSSCSCTSEGENCGEMNVHRPL